MKRNTVITAAAVALQACAHAETPRAQVTGSAPSLEQRLRISEVEVRGTPAQITIASARQAASTREAGDGSPDAAGRTLAMLGDMFAASPSNEGAVPFLLAVTAVTVVVLLPIAVIVDAVNDRATTSLPPKAPAGLEALHAAIGSWATAGGVAASPDALLARAVASAGAGSGYAFHVRPADAPPRDPAAAGRASLEVSVLGAGLEQSGPRAGLSLFVDVVAVLGSSGMHAETLSVRVRDSEPYSPTRWASNAQDLVDVRMPVLLRRAGGVLLHELLLFAPASGRDSVHGSSVCDLGPMLPDGERFDLASAPELPRAADGRMGLAWEPWWRTPGEGAYDLRIYAVPVRDGDAPIVSADGLRTNSVLLGSLAPSRRYALTVRAVDSRVGKRLVSRWWRRSEGTPCSPLDAVEPPPDQLFEFETPAP